MLYWGKGWEVVMECVICVLVVCVVLLVVILWGCDVLILKLMLVVGNCVVIELLYFLLLLVLCGFFGLCLFSCVNELFVGMGVELIDWWLF